MNNDQNDGEGRDLITEMLTHGYGYVQCRCGDAGALHYNSMTLVLKREDNEPTSSFRDRIIRSMKPGDDVELTVRHHRIDIANIRRMV